VLCGANMDFSRLAWIARHAGIGARTRRYYRFEIGEQSGTMLHLAEVILEGINIIEFQYGKTDGDKAWPVIGFEASPPELDLLDKRLSDEGIPHEDVTSQEDVEFRMINYNTELMRHPLFIRLDFPERAGALYEFLQHIKGEANLCYFNYVFTGEEVGRALMGMEFPSSSAQEQFVQRLEASAFAYHPIEGRALDRIAGL